MNGRLGAGLSVAVLGAVAIWTSCCGTAAKTAGDVVASGEDLTAGDGRGAGGDRRQGPRSVPSGLQHPDHRLGITEGVGSIPPAMMRDYDMGSWWADMAEDVELLRGAHARWYRQNSGIFPAFNQRAVERNRDWTYRDALVRSVEEAGVDMLVTIGRTNGLASCFKFKEQLPESLVPTTDEERRRYVEYVKSVVERYDGDGVDDMEGLVAPVRWFQLGNENDMHCGICARQGREYATPQQYLELARLTREAMDAASPEARLVVGMAFGFENDTSWGEELLRLEDGAIFGVVDALDFHDYTGLPETQTRKLDLLTERTRGRIPIWITETSMPGDPEAKRGWNRQRQARVMVTLVMQALARENVGRVFWHQLTDSPPRDAPSWRAFGTNSVYACVDPVKMINGHFKCSSFALKPVGYAFRALSDALEGATAVEELDGGAGWRIVRPKGGDALVIRDGGDPTGALAGFGGGKVQVLDLVGGGGAFSRPVDPAKVRSSREPQLITRAAK